MKIEKLTDNKIRIIVNLEDLQKKNINLHSLMSNSIESQSLLVDILEEAEKEVGFSTNGCKVSIEAFASSDGHFIFTITKTASEAEKITPKKKKLSIKRKETNIDFERSIYKFATFDELCKFCSYINSINFKDLKNLAQNTSLYLQNNTYYLVLSDINLKYANLKGFYAIISEFAILVSHNSSFESNLNEHGKVIMKNNALKRCIKYFA